jgi:hypothetical protein
MFAKYRWTVLYIHQQKQNSHLNNIYSDNYNPFYDTLFSYTAQQHAT